MDIGAGLGRLVDALIGVLKWLVLPLSLLLFLQWPLRELVQAYSREANDLGQILFALLIAGSVAAATRAGGHLAAGGLGSRLSPRVHKVLAVLAYVLALLPFGLFVLVSVRPVIVSSVGLMERFPETSNPGYWVVKVALALLIVLLLLAGLIDVMRSEPKDNA